jgi:hypothetical protein
MACETGHQLVNVLFGQAHVMLDILELKKSKGFFCRLWRKIKPISCRPSTHLF